MGNEKESSNKESVTKVPDEKIEVLSPLSEEKEKFEPALLRKELDSLIDEFNRIEDQISFGFERIFEPITKEGKKRIERQKEITKRVKEIAEKLGIKVGVKV